MKKLRLTKKYLLWILMPIFAALGVGELFARYYLGLGTPPLSVTHQTIEYMYVPNQDVYRFGNHFTTNQYGMRTMPFAANKSSGEFRIMVFGDSIVNGGALTANAALATTLIQSKLDRSSNRQTIVVGNISAGSWGPGNWLAYANEYGFFGADVIVLVISSHDYADNPTFAPLNPTTHPTAAPISALVEGITTYLPRYLPQTTMPATVERFKAPTEPNRSAENANEPEVLKGLTNLKIFLNIAKTNSKNVLVFQHWEKPEIEQGFPNAGNNKIREVCKSMGIEPISLAPYFRRSIASGKDPYRDYIHPNIIGQQLIAEAILAHLP